MIIRTSNDIEEAERIWNILWPQEDIFGCWQVRKCFNDSYARPPVFLIAETAGRPAGLLPLSWIEEERYYGFFPGESWKGRTWLEQNRVLASSPDLTRELWNAAPSRTRIRYLNEGTAARLSRVKIDETGYLFHPSRYRFDFENYWQCFSGKSRKRLGREIESFEQLSRGWSRDESGDIEWMLETNLTQFGGDSYFDDPRFTRGFESMLSFLSNEGMLRVATVTVGGRLAAVDVGALYNNRYWVLAGAASPEFRGIAKAINLFHIEAGCRERFDRIDFLCGDFGWKERFHLEPRPLYIAANYGIFRNVDPASENLHIWRESAQGVFTGDRI